MIIFFSVTPPMKNVKKRRFRKTLKKKVLIQFWLEDIYELLGNPTT